MQDLQTEVFTAFRHAALQRGVYPTTRIGADAKYTTRFGNWLRVVSNHRTPLDDPDYTLAWVFPRLPHPTHKLHNLQKQVVTLIVAMNERTGKIVIAERQGNLSPLQDSKIYTAEGILRALKDKRFNHGTSFKDSYAHIAAFLSGFELKLTFRAAGYFESVHTEVGTPKKSRAPLNNIAVNVASQVMRREQDIALGEIETLIKRPLLDFAERLYATHSARWHKHRNYSSLSIYNFLTDAPSPQAAEYRMGALNAIAPLGQIFDDFTNFWEQVDRGVPVFTALAAECGVAPQTIRHMVRRADIYHQFASFKKWAGELDAVELSNWPATYDDACYFENMTHIADTHENVFRRDKGEVYRRWLLERRRRKEQTWKDIFRYELRNEMAETLKVWKEQRSTLVGRVLDGTYTPNSADQIRQVREFCSRAVSIHQGSIRHVKDMQNDVTTRLIRPAILLAMERGGRGYVDEESIEGFEKAIEKTMWGATPPSDQIAASAYWHSPRVNFRQRLESTAIATDDDAVWVTLLKAPMTLPNGAVLVPLTSKMDLRAEADVMHHCVWSYTNYCLTESYHIFSVQDKDGKHLTTLTVQDYVDKDTGKRRVKRRENLGYKNAYPSKQASDAAQLFLDGIEAGTITVDWAAIDKSKEKFLAKKLQGSVGYDFHDPQICDDMVELYRPCLPRHLSGIIRSFADIEHLLTTEWCPELAPQPTPPHSERGLRLE